MQASRRNVLKSMAAFGAAAAWPMARAQSTGEWVVGQITPLSGPQGAGPAQQMTGIQLAFNKANAAGGVAGRPLKLVTRDDKYQAAEAPRQFDALLDSGVKPIALVGAFGTDNTDALIKHPAFVRSGLPLVGGRTGASVLRAPANRQVFHLRASYHDEIEKIVEQLFNNGVKNIGMVSQIGGFGQDCLTGLKESLQKRGLTMGRTVELDLKVEHLPGLVKTLSEAMPQAVILAASAAPAAAFMREFRKAGANTQLFGLSSVDADLLVSTLGAEGARGIMLTEIMPDQVQKQLLFTRDFLADLKQYGEGKVAPGFAAAEGYLIGRVFVEALRRASPNPTSAKLTDVLESMSGYDVGGIPISFSRNDHVGTHYVDTAVISSGGKLQY